MLEKFQETSIYKYLIQLFMEKENKRKSLFARMWAILLKEKVRFWISFVICNLAALVFGSACSFGIFGGIILGYAGLEMLNLVQVDNLSLVAFAIGFTSAAALLLIFPNVFHWAYKKSREISQMEDYIFEDWCLIRITVVILLIIFCVLIAGILKITQWIF